MRLPAAFHDGKDGDDDNNKPRMEVPPKRRRTTRIVQGVVVLPLVVVVSLLVVLLLVVTTHYQSQQERTTTTTSHRHLNQDWILETHEYTTSDFMLMASSNTAGRRRPGPTLKVPSKSSQPNAGPEPDDAKQANRVPPKKGETSTSTLVSTKDDSSSMLLAMASGTDHGKAPPGKSQTWTKPPAADHDITIGGGAGSSSTANANTATWALTPLLARSDTNKNNKNDKDQSSKNDQLTPFVAMVDVTHGTAPLVLTRGAPTASVFVALDKQHEESRVGLGTQFPKASLHIVQYTTNRQRNPVTAHIRLEATDIEPPQEQSPMDPKDNPNNNQNKKQWTLTSSKTKSNQKEWTMSSTSLRIPKENDTKQTTTANRESSLSSTKDRIVWDLAGTFFFVCCVCVCVCV